ncbi:F-box/kelch-repeat protein [Tripterygium wilfordii]|uniref:F-box/kelch-repeat protein n=1 Tax=Tripterygium wilfordii TaxID=458696 RepID=A0A7J7CGD1_TRIWF|nr:F-box/kelch-repeat protein [Tripterygium wilfordii]
MEVETSRVNHCLDDIAQDAAEFYSLSEPSDEGNKETTVVSVDLILPDNLLEQILAYLPSQAYLEQVRYAKDGMRLSVGYAYDPGLRKWYGI